ncbi:hypothetical protein K491DRAFT_760877 [Lophiostoma macrostomum CBS 122681]|uniref:Uncharacterized protein n=1 Tax=Lophiostoma macrostomum CBS 122681 TaxID=1314788 RepID=A0A6A6SVI8_9PLEO|nr:hypothetical protein K491DRAFT_760877 [Lophiostoma macrostomum CBS 122681]
MSYIELTNLPCNPDYSPYHDLACRHRIKTAFPEFCSPNCQVPRGRQGFLCPECLVDTVTMEVQLADLCMTTDEAGERTRTTRSELVRAIVDKKVYELQKRGYWRLCTVVEKMDPILQFYDSFPEAHYAEMMDGMDEVRSRKRPSAKATKKKSANPQSNLTNSSASQASVGQRAVIPGFNSSDVHSLIEDEATKAVREVLERLALGSTILGDASGCTG